MIKTRIFQRDDPVTLQRDQLDWKGYELAQVINIFQGSLSDIENGKSYPSAPTIIKIMTKTDIDIHWLLLGE